MGHVKLLILKLQRRRGLLYADSCGYQESYVITMQTHQTKITGVLKKSVRHRKDFKMEKLGNDFSNFKFIQIYF